MNKARSNQGQRSTMARNTPRPRYAPAPGSSKARTETGLTNT